MSGYVEAGYAIALSVISSYALSIVWRERAARRRIGDRPKAAPPPGADHRNGSRP